MMKKKVMVFGVFDGLHPGHHYFLESAATFGDELAVVVARDNLTRVLKNKTPLENEEQRLLGIQNLSYITHSFLGDEIIGSYGV